MSRRFSLRRILSYLFCALTFICCGLAQARPLRVLVTHPRAEVLHHYVTMVRQHVFDPPDLELVGVYHASETEDYSDAAAYIAREKIDWVHLQKIECPLTAHDIFNENACRDAFARSIEDAAGIIFNGGPDIPPALYGSRTELTTAIITPHRHYFEVSFLANLVGTAKNRKLTPLLSHRPDFAILAICVGMQSLNVADGGTLIQDIPSDVYHLRTLEDVKSVPVTWHRSVDIELEPEPGMAAGVFHPVRLTAAAPDALRIVGIDMRHGPQVLSIHHQAVGRLGADLLVTARSYDGKIIEGVRHKTFANVIGWQFHPERSYLWSQGEEQRASVDATDRNFAFTTLQNDPRSRAFHEALWRNFSELLQHSASHAPSAPDKRSHPVAP